MLSGKQRAALRSLSASLDTIVHIGKGGITDNVAAQMSDALEARELVKGRVLENAGLSAREACDMLAERCRAEPVQVIGSRFVLYRKKPEEKKRPASPPAAGKLRADTSSGAARRLPPKGKPSGERTGKPRSNTSSATAGKPRSNAATPAAGKPFTKRTGAGPGRDAPGGAARARHSHPRRGR
jgi:RNA-binding protein